MEEVGVKQSSAMVFLCLPLAFLLLQKLPRGMPRFLFVFLPSLPLLAWLPFTISIHSLRVFVAFWFLWLCPTKLLLLCWDVSIDHTTPPFTDSFSYFIFYIIAPLRIKGPTKSSSAANQNLLPAKPSSKLAPIPLFLLHLLGFFLVLNCCMHFRNKISIWLHYALLVVEIYFALQVSIGGIGLIARYIVGVEIYPAHNAPFIASSLSDFWGKRWNPMVSTLLRASVHDPILLSLSRLLSTKKDSNGVGAFRKIKNESVNMEFKQGVVVKRASSSHKISSNAIIDLVANGGEIRDRPPFVAKAIAVLTSFAVSGVMHEAIICCMTQSHPTWEATAFFIVQGVAIILQFTLRRYLPTSFKFPRFLSIAFTLGFVHMTLCWLFFPPIYRPGVELSINSEFYEAQAFLFKLIPRVL